MHDDEDTAHVLSSISSDELAREFEDSDPVVSIWSELDVESDFVSRPSGLDDQDLEIADLLDREY